MKSNRKQRLGFSLMELAVTTAILALVATSSMTLVRTAYTAWNRHDDDQSQRQQAAAVLRHVCRHVRQAKAVMAISTAADNSGSGRAELSIVVREPSAEDPAETEPAASDQALAEQKTAVAYQPPFPDRVDLFLAPKREGRSKNRNDQEDAVELLGFVNVDLQRAVLMINGAVYPVAEGDTRFGVEVISIQPPAVVLQRGRQRWQASLEN